MPFKCPSILAQHYSKQEIIYKYFPLKIDTFIFRINSSTKFGLRLGYAARMITVNPIFINEVLSPIVGGADHESDLEIYGHYRPDVEQDVKELATLTLLPDFKKQKDIFQKAVKNSLSYYLMFPQKVDFESIFNSLLLPLETPKNSRLFFQWIWEVFFPGESKDFIMNETVVEDFDVSAPFYLLTGLGGYNTPLN